MNNVLRQSGATELRLTVRLDPDVLKAEIADNGRGFDVAAGGRGQARLAARGGAQGGGTSSAAGPPR